MKNNLKNKRGLDTSNRKVEHSTFDDDDCDINRRSRSNEIIGSPTMISLENFNLKDSQKIVRGKSKGDSSLKSHDLIHENFSNETNNN